MEQQSVGFAIGSRQMRVTAAVLRNELFPDLKPKDQMSKKWAKLFLARYPFFSIRKAASVPAHRAKSANPVLVGRYFKMIRGVIDTFKPKLTFNADETMCQISMAGVAYVVCLKGTKPTVPGSDDRTHISIIEYVNSEGKHIMPSSFIYPRATFADFLTSADSPASRTRAPLASEELLDIERILAKGNVDEARRRLRQAANTEKLREEQRAAKVLPAPNLKAQGQSPKRKYLAFQPKAEGELISGAEYRARAQADDAKKQQAAEEKKQKKEERKESRGEKVKEGRKSKKAG